MALGLLGFGLIAVNCEVEEDLPTLGSILKYAVAHLVVFGVLRENEEIFAFIELALYFS